MRLEKNEIKKFAYRYNYSNDASDFTTHKKSINKRGFILLSELSAVAKWKSARSAGHTLSNSENFVNAISKFSLSTSNERSKVEVLTLLDGVKYPTASVILHFFHPDPYPILDVRAIWSLEMRKPKTYDFSFWWDYVKNSRQLAKDLDITMRTLDKALWQYSKERQDSL